MDVKPSTNLTVRGTFHFGKDVIQFEAGSFASVGSEDFEFQRLSQLVANARKNFIDTIAPTLIPAQQPSDATILNPTWTRVEEVSKTTDKGKTVIKAHFGKFKKFGVPLWPEVLERAEVYPDQVPDKPFEPKMMAVLWGMDAGNKPRVTQVVIGDKAKEVLNVRD